MDLFIDAHHFLIKVIFLLFCSSIGGKVGAQCIWLSETLDIAGSLARTVSQSNCPRASH